jgi:hypothetical protein
VAEAIEEPTRGTEPAGGDVGVAGVEPCGRCPADDTVQLRVSNSNQVKRHIRMHTHMVRRLFPVEKWQE